MHMCNTRVSFKSAEKTICGIEIIHMIRKGQLE